MFKRFLKKLLKESMLLKVKKLSYFQEVITSALFFFKTRFTFLGQKSVGQTNLKLRDKLGVWFIWTDLDFLAFVAGGFNFSFIVSLLVGHLV